jgi:hypothetical protein
MQDLCSKSMAGSVFVWLLALFTSLFYIQLVVASFRFDNACTLAEQVYTGNLNRQIEQYKEMIRIPHLT